MAVSEQTAEPESSASALSDHFTEELALIQPFISPDTHTHTHDYTHRQKQAKSICNRLNKGAEDGIRKLLTAINNEKAAGSVDSRGDGNHMNAAFV